MNGAKIDPRAPTTAECTLSALFVLERSLTFDEELLITSSAIDGFVYDGVQDVCTIDDIDAHLKN